MNCVLAGMSAGYLSHLCYNLSLTKINKMCLHGFCDLLLIRE